MPLKIVTHELTEEDFKQDTQAQYIAIQGYIPTWWERLRKRLRFKDDNNSRIK